MRLPFRIEFHACNCKSRTLVDSVSMTVVTQEAYDSGVNWLSPTHDKCFLRRTLVFRPELLRIHWRR
jgi:hypothetical protein